MFAKFLLTAAESGESELEYFNIEGTFAKLWDNYFLHPNSEIPYQFGRICFVLDLHACAINYFVQGLLLTGRDAHTLFNLGLALSEIGDLRGAEKCVSSL
jgi:hypothetical protein